MVGAVDQWFNFRHRERRLSLARTSAKACQAADDRTARAKVMVIKRDRNKPRSKPPGWSTGQRKSYRESHRPKSRQTRSLMPPVGNRCLPIILILAGLGHDDGSRCGTSRQAPLGIIGGMVWFLPCCDILRIGPATSIVDVVLMALPFVAGCNVVVYCAESLCAVTN